MTKIIIIIWILCWVIDCLVAVNKSKYKHWIKLAENVIDVYVYVLISLIFCVRVVFRGQCGYFFNYSNNKIVFTLLFIWPKIWEKITWVKIEWWVCWPIQYSICWSIIMELTYLYNLDALFCVTFNLYIKNSIILKMKSRRCGVWGL